MRKSDIFESYIKIAQAQDESAKKALENNPRASSQSIKDLESQYDLKLDSIPEMKYKRNIVEIAHPKSVVVAPSYDKTNGLVENVNERQDIILNILNKTPDGNNTHFKYAQQELVLSLVSLANDLDNKDQEELTKLADTCLQQTSEQIVKNAIEPITMGIIATVAVIGIIYANQHLPNANEGFETNNTNLINEINDLLKSNSDWGVGYDLSEEVKDDMNNFIEQLNRFHNVYTKIQPLLAQIEKPKDAKELQQIAAQPQTDKIIKAKELLYNEFKNMSPFLATVERNFKSDSYKQRMITHKGALTWLADKTQILHGGAGLIADDFDDVVHAIAPYKKSVDEILKILTDAKSIEQNAKNQLMAAHAPTTPVTQSSNVPTQDHVDADKEIQKLLTPTDIPAKASSAREHLKKIANGG